MGIESLKNISLSRDSNIPLAEYFIETFMFELCLNFNNSVFNNKHYLQVDSAA